MKKILITGGAGFIGSALTTELIKLGHEVVVFDKLSSQIHGQKKPEDFDFYSKVKFIKDDILNIFDYKHKLSEIDFVFHLASETGTGQSMYEIEKYCHANICGTATLLEYVALNQDRISNFVLASSRAVYGEGKYHCLKHGIRYPQIRSIEKLSSGLFETYCEECSEQLQALPTDEKSNLNPLSIYALTKLTQESMLKIIFENLATSYTILRFQNVYGPGQSMNNPYTGIISIFTNLLMNNKEIEIFEDGLESRDFVYIQNIVDVLLEIINNKLFNNNVINVGSGNRTSVVELAKQIADIHHKINMVKVSGRFRKGDIRHNFADLNKLKMIMPKYQALDLKAGLSKFTEWASSRVQDDLDYKKSIQELEKKGLLN